MLLLHAPSAQTGWASPPSQKGGYPICRIVLSKHATRGRPTFHDTPSESLDAIRQDSCTNGSQPPRSADRRLCVGPGRPAGCPRQTPPEARCPNFVFCSFPLVLVRRQRRFLLPAGVSFLVAVGFQESSVQGAVPRQPPLLPRSPPSALTSASPRRCVASRAASIASAPVQQPRQTADGLHGRWVFTADGPRASG